MSKEENGQQGPEVVRLQLTNRQLIDLHEGLRGFLNYFEPIDTNALWNADSILERITGKADVARRGKTRILEKHARKGEDKRPMRQADDQGRVGYVIPRGVKPIADDELEAYLDQPAKLDLDEEAKEAVIVFPASWRIPYGAFPKAFIGLWLKGLRPVVMREEESSQEEQKEAAEKVV
jgi:hypothetical protein